MGKNSSIEWTRHTWNPIRGCSRLFHGGCDHCYAEAMSKRNPATLGVWGPNGARSFGVESYWRQPAKWNTKAAEAGEVHSVFCMSLADLFEGPHEQDGEGNWTELRTGPRPDYIPTLERMVETFAPLTNLRVLALTKRTWNAVQWAEARGGWPANWWLGASVENQAAANERIPFLLKVPTRVRFLSCEPLLGPVDLSEWMAPNSDLLPGNRWAECLCSKIDPSDRPCFVCEIRGISWVIVGGESGPHARPVHPDWVRGLRDQCQRAGAAFHFKQWGEWGPWLNEAHYTHNGAEKHAHQWLQPDGTGGHCWIVDDDGLWSNWTGDPPETDVEHKATRTVIMGKHGKHAAGRTLDGRIWDGFPAVAP